MKALGNPEMLLPFIANFFEVRFTQDQAPVVQRILSLNSKLFAKILYYMVQSLECTFIQGSDKVVMVIC